MTWEIWDRESGNCLGVFETEEKAKAALVDWQRANPDFVDDFVMAETPRRDDADV